MKRLTYLLALGAILTLGTGCDKEPATDSINTPVPLYVNTWTVTEGDESTDKGPQTAILRFNADKTFCLGYLATEKYLKDLKDKIMPSGDNTPTIDGDNPATDGDASETSDEMKEMIEKINSIQVNDVVVVFSGMYVETRGKKDDDSYLSLFVLLEVDGTNIEMAEAAGVEFHLTDVTENTMTIKDERNDKNPGMKLQSLATSGLTLGRFVDCSDFLD